MLRLRAWFKEVFKETSVKITALVLVGLAGVIGTAVWSYWAQVKASLRDTLSIPSWLYLVVGVVGIAGWCAVWGLVRRARHIERITRPQARATIQAFNLKWQVSREFLAFADVSPLTLSGEALDTLIKGPRCTQCGWHRQGAKVQTGHYGTDYLVDDPCPNCQHSVEIGNTPKLTRYLKETVFREAQRLHHNNDLHFI